jgi:hypothetical protein
MSENILKIHPENVEQRDFLNDTGDSRIEDVVIIDGETYRCVGFKSCKTSEEVPRESAVWEERFNSGEALVSERIYVASGISQSPENEWIFNNTMITFWIKETELNHGFEEVISAKGAQL